MRVLAGLVVLMISGVLAFAVFVMIAVVIRLIDRRAEQQWLDGQQQQVPSRLPRDYWYRQ